MAEPAKQINGISLEAFRDMVASLGFAMKAKDEQDYLAMVRLAEQSVLYVDGLPEYHDPRLAPTAGPRAFQVPSREENPLNAWSHRFELRDPSAAAAAGLLAGRTVAIKDTVSVAGIPLTCGTQPYHLTGDGPGSSGDAGGGYPIPAVDAPVVSRILGAGGIIKGTSTCENYCLSGLSFTSATGPVDNPWLRGYSTGGSSSGSAALVAIKTVRAWREKRGLPEVEDLGEGVDMALGGDQGGSVRLPAAMSGVYGLKPTHGLVPYTGIASLHPLVDHCGPIAGSIADVAVLLTAIAGYDGMDPRCSPRTPLREAVPAYHEQLAAALAGHEHGKKGLRVGVLKEAFELPELHADVSSTVRRAAERFASLGGTVVEVSVPLHVDAMKIWSAVVYPQMADVVLRNAAPDLLAGHGLAHVRPPPRLSQAWYDTMTASNPAVVLALLATEYLAANRADVFPHSMRAKALSHVHQLRAAYDALFEDVDVLILPVTPCVGPPHPGEGAGAIQKFAMALGMSGNTAPFNITGHPALSIPAGWAAATPSGGDGGDQKKRLPVGMQIVGRRFDEVGVLLAGALWERGGLGLDEE